MNNGMNTLWYRAPAATWNEALPLGSGRLGAMVFGGGKTERICLNEDTLWSGRPSFYTRPGAPEAMAQAQKLVLEGKYAEAQRLLEERFTGLWSQVYLPLGDIDLTMAHGEEEDLTRSLDLTCGIHTVTYTAGSIRYTREMFVSYPDHALVMRLSADAPAALSFTAKLVPALQAEVSAQGAALELSGHAPTYVWHYGDPASPRGQMTYGDGPETWGVGYLARLEASCEGGTVHAEDGTLTVAGADAVTLVLAARTSYAGWDKDPVAEALPYEALCREEAEKALAKGYTALLDAHTADFTALMARCTLSLPTTDASFLPTDERLYAHENGEEDPALYALYFAFGRYLTAAASRPGTQPTNLQGIWNDKVAPPWNSNYTININTEMNYWPTEAVNLSECTEPMTRLVKELSASGARTAREWYGAPGWCSHHNTDLWRLSTPVGAQNPGCAVYAQWPMSGAWMTRHLVEHWLYTGDTAYLAEIYPVLKGSADFLLSRLAEDGEGHLMVAPSTSPENNFRLDGQPVAVAATTAMTQSIVKELFTHLTEAASALGVEDDTVKAAAAALPKLRPLGIGAEGELLEWNENFEENEIHHRHISHLYGLYPAHEIDPVRDAALTEAVKTTLARRGDESTGWAMGWRICCWARLRDGDHALRLLDLQLRTVEGHNPKLAAMKHDDDGVINYTNGGGTYLNLFDAHPPFQIDGNYGATAGIAEMLLQTDAEGRLLFLPAKPAAWTKGEVTGLRAPGNRTVSIRWEGDKADITVTQGK